MSESTEDMACRYRGMDTWGTDELLNALWSSQMQAVAACLPALPALTATVAAATRQLAGTQGRLVYAGAGSSGTVALLDAIDLGATFGWPDERLLILLADGLDLGKGLAPEKEDNEESGRRRSDEAALGRNDVVIGVSASGNSAFTVGIVDQARRHGALSVCLTSTPESPLARAAEYPLVVATGAEVLAGSTRLAAGTAQKVVLNLFSTAVMTGLGHVHDNLMVNIRPGNAKLERRCAAIVSEIARVGDIEAALALKRHGTIKQAVLGLAGVPDGEIPILLARTGGNLRAALEAARRPGDT
jgi:N-acetylmuramic acid 6-phosphate etherase